MNVVSLFDGCSCARVALERAGAKDIRYACAEIDKYAISIAKKNYPDSFMMGDVRNTFFYSDYILQEPVDLLIGGSPCQDLSIAKQERKGLAGERSGLFYTYLEVLSYLKPQYFILENVYSMPKDSRDEISRLLGVEPIMIDAGLVSAQTRRRWFWTNIPNVHQPFPRDIRLKDILQDNVDSKYNVNISPIYKLKGYKGADEKALCLTASMFKGYGNDGVTIIKLADWGKGGQAQRIYSTEGKSVTLSANAGGQGAKTGVYEVDGVYRKLTPVECERLQGLPDDYTAGVSDTQRYKMIGNAFNVDVIAHILRTMPTLKGGE